MESNTVLMYSPSNMNLKFYYLVVDIICSSSLQ
jgi:hypothetical protein